MLFDRLTDKPRSLVVANQLTRVVSNPLRSVRYVSATSQNHMESNFHPKTQRVSETIDHPLHVVSNWRFCIMFRVFFSTRGAAASTDSREMHVINTV